MFFDASPVLTSTPTATAVISATQSGPTFAFVNPAFSALTGFDAEECVGAGHALLFGGDPGRAGIEGLTAAIDERRQWHAQLALLRKTGETIWVDASTAPIEGGSPTGGLSLLALTDVSALKAAADEDREAAEYLAGVVRGLPGFVFSRVLRADGAIDHIAPEWVIDPSSRKRVMTRFDPFERVHPDDHDTLRRAIDQSIATRAAVTSDYRIVKPDGARWYRVRAVPRAAGDDVVWDGVGFDVTDDKDRNDWLLGIADNIPGFLFRRIHQPDGRLDYTFVAPMLSRMLGVDPDVEITPADFWKLIHPDDAPRAREAIERSTRERSGVVIECRLLAADGSERWIRSYATPRPLASGATAWDGLAVDVTAEKEAAQRLDYLASHDPLTGLPNRTRLGERLATAVAEVRATGGLLALSTIVLSGLSEINETLGPKDGDVAFKGAAARLSEQAASASAFAARTAGNLLAVFRSVPTADDGDDFITTLMRSLSRPIPVAGILVMMEPCIGTAVFRPEDLEALGPADVAEELMKRSSMALSSAERLGPGTRLTYSSAIDHRSHHRMELRHAMHRAIEAEEFALHFQPMVDLDTGGIVGAEALIRWSHPQFGMLRPDLFIPLAEQSGMIVPMGEWVIQEALRQLRRFQGIAGRDLKMAINVSALQIKSPGFPDMLRKAIENAGVRAGSVEIEITEGLLLESSPEARESLGRIDACGVSIAIDDFGAGHASFQYLRDFPIHKLKIDQMFVRQLVVNSSDALIVQAIATLARSLGLELVAEGIETVEQHQFLREHGCTLGQGYLFSLPLAAEDLAWVLSNHTSLPLPALHPSPASPVAMNG